MDAEELTEVWGYCCVIAPCLEGTMNANTSSHTEWCTGGQYKINYRLSNYVYSSELFYRSWK